MNMQERTTCLVDALDAVALHVILSKLDGPSLAMAECTCTAFRHVIADADALHSSMSLWHDAYQALGSTAFHANTNRQLDDMLSGKPCVVAKRSAEEPALYA